MRALITALAEAAPDPRLMEIWKAVMPESFTVLGQKYTRRYVTGFAAGAGAIRRTPDGIRIRYIGKTDEFSFYAYIDPADETDAKHYKAKKTRFPSYKTDGLEYAPITVDFTWSRGGGTVMFLGRFKPTEKVAASTMGARIYGLLDDSENDGEASAS
jgi:hypothetical protein